MGGEGEHDQSQDEQSEDIEAALAADDERIRGALDSMRPEAKERVLSALEAVEGLNGDDLGEWVSNKGQFPYVRYSPEVSELQAAIYDAGLVVPFAWPAWMQTLDDPSDLPIDDPVSAARTVTAIVRGNRFNEGLLLERLQSGELPNAIRAALGD